MRYLLSLTLLLCLVNVNAQTNNKISVEGPDSLNATFVPANMLARYEIAVVNGVDYIEIINVYEPTEVILFDLNGKLVYKEKIQHRTRIEKHQFAKGFYVIKTRSEKLEAVKKLYL